MLLRDPWEGHVVTAKEEGRAGGACDRFSSDCVFSDSFRDGNV